MKEDTSHLSLYNVTEQYLVELEDRYSASIIPEDLSIKENYEMVRKACAELRNARCRVEDRRKELKKEVLARGRMIDGAAKKIKDRISALEKPFVDAKKAYDERKEIERREKARKEEMRVNSIRAKIDEIKSMPSSAIRMSVDEIEKVIEDLKGNDVGKWAQEFAPVANQRKAEALSALHELLSVKKIASAKKQEQKPQPEKRPKPDESSMRFAETVNAMNRFHGDNTKMLAAIKGGEFKYLRYIG